MSIGIIGLRRIKFYGHVRLYETKPVYLETIFHNTSMHIPMICESIESSI